MVDNTTYYPPVGFYYKVLFQGLEGNTTVKEAGFKEISGLSTESQKEDITEGGSLEYRHKLPSPAQSTNLVMKRGLIVDSELSKWIEKGINEFSYKPLTVIVQLLEQDSDINEKTKPLMSWTFYKVWPVKWEVANFDSLSKDIVVESIELAYDYFEVKNGS